MHFIVVNIFVLLREMLKREMKMIHVERFSLIINCCRFLNQIN